MNRVSASKRPCRRWLHSLLLGCACYALANGLVHFSDWCYLAASAAVAAVVSAGLQPLQQWLVAQLPQQLRKWSLLWALGSALAVFGLGVLLTWPLRSWPGPNGLWPWGAGALLATAWTQLTNGTGIAVPEIGMPTTAAALPASVPVNPS